MIIGTVTATCRIMNRSRNPTQEQLVSMQLRDGENAVAFRVGRTTLSAHLYVLPADARVCVSDVDGTITKSAGPTMS